MCIEKWKRSQHLINNVRRKINVRRKLKNENASITLEAALVMPLFITFLFVFYASIIAISSQMALQHMAAESAQRIANYIHPVALTAEYIKDQTEFDDSITLSMPEEGMAKVIHDLGGMLPSPLDQLLQEGTKGNYWPVANLALTVLGRDLFQKVMLADFEHTRLKKDNIKLVYLQLPDLLYGTDQHVAVALEYDLPFQIPFIGYQFKVREQAMHRVWLPDVRSSDYEVIEQEENDDFIYVVSIDPNPVKRGRTATVTISTVPNKTVDLEIHYKSGKSVARNLGPKTADANGTIQWSWYVSGNTTKGTWEMRFKINDTEYSVIHPFEVG